MAFHGGIDFRVSTGTPINSAGNGIVVHAGRNGGYGKMIEIDHGNGLTTRYAHLSKILVKQGRPRALGERIGKAGSTGRSTGPHLHYEVRRNGNAVDPMRFLKTAKKLKPLLGNRGSRSEQFMCAKTNGAAFAAPWLLQTCLVAD
jgi:murein DD-endopeptidase MepM/ murein hydrolase activator NlpD